MIFLAINIDKSFDSHHLMTPFYLPDVMRPILFVPPSVNQRLPSGPAVIAPGWLPGVGRGNSLMLPPGVMRPILSPDTSVNQRLPSDPDAILVGLLFWGKGNSLALPLGVMRPILFPDEWINQRLPSGPDAMSSGKLP